MHRPTSLELPCQEMLGFVLHPNLRAAKHLRARIGFPKNLPGADPARAFPCDNAISAWRDESWKHYPASLTIQMENHECTLINTNFCELVSIRGFICSSNPQITQISTAEKRNEIIFENLRNLWIKNITINRPPSPEGGGNRWECESPRGLKRPHCDHPFDLADRLTRIEAFRAGVGAVHDGVTAEQPEGVFQLVEPLARRLVAAVGNPPIGLE